jgi:hypothetical protein
VREAMQDTTASNRSPANPSRAIDAVSTESTTLTAAPSNSLALSVGLSDPPTPERVRTKHTTSCPRRKSAPTVARPIVPVAPRTQRRWRAFAVTAEAQARAKVGSGATVIVPRKVLFNSANAPANVQVQLDLPVHTSE